MVEQNGLPRVPKAAAKAKPAPPQCDLVMKGGITSGVVYPKAAVELSRAYSFRRIGGSSAGAIAAVLTAAAQYSRSAGTETAESGFARLAGLSGRLQHELLPMFEPSARTRGVFRFLIAWIEPGVSAPVKVLLALWRLIVGALPTFLIAVLLLLLPWFATAAALLGGLDGDRLALVLRSLLVWALPAAAGGVIAAAVRLVIRALRDLNENGFGLCRGHVTDDSPALTDWLAREINLTAGIRSGKTMKPLTFGDLWGAEARLKFRKHLSIPDSTTPDDPDEFHPDAKLKSGIPAIQWVSFDPLIDLRVMTTCLTQQVPRVFPFWDDAYAYCPTCLADYFPDWVMAHLNAFSRNPGGVNAEGQRGWTNAGQWVAALCPRDGTELRKLPLARDMPIVVAARLSLSFPVLISAVPLYYADFAKTANQLNVVTAWFSDGGITSNFPMQFFDGWLPTRPTFGIDLEDFDARYDAEGTTVKLPPASDSLRLLRETPILGVPAFLMAIVNTMHGWPDRLQMEAPGFRDRIVTVCTQPSEGGLNLKMSDKDVERLSDKGGSAGILLRDGFSFDVHRWIRFRIAMNGLSVALARFRTQWPEFSAQVPTQPPDAPYQLPREADVRLEGQAVSAMADRWRTERWPAATGAPRPEPELKFGSGSR